MPCVYRTDRTCKRELKNFNIIQNARKISPEHIKMNFDFWMIVGSGHLKNFVSLSKRYSYIGNKTTNILLQFCDKE